jgi:hypothetical protein
MTTDVRVVLSKKMPPAKDDLHNGVQALAKPMAKDNGVQYVLYAFLPVEDAKSRADGTRTIKAEVLSVEPLVTADHRRAAEVMLREARLARRGHEEQELPLDD